MKNSAHKKKFQKVAPRKYQTSYVVSVIKVNRFSVLFFFFVFKNSSQEIHKSRNKIHVLDRRDLQIFLSCTDPNMNPFFFLQSPGCRGADSRHFFPSCKILLLYSQTPRTGCVTKSFRSSLTLSYSRSVISHCQQALS